MDKNKIIFEDLQKQLLEWNQKFRKLESRLCEAETSHKTSYSEPIEILHPEIKLVEMRMAELRVSGEEALDELRRGLQKAVKDLEEAYVKASHHSHPEANKSFA